jgi:alcohol dehydrogenase (NADP+)
MNTRAYAAYAAREKLKPFEFNRRELLASDVELDIKYAGICHSDIHTVRDEWGAALYPCVPGHEIVGTVSKIGKDVTKFKVGDRIGVGVFVDSCKTCVACKRGLQNYCIEGMTGTYNNLERDGKTPAQGGYSNRFVINEEYAVHIPENLDLAGVAPLLCAGITLYSPIVHWGTAPGKKVGIIGLGGLGHMGVKIAAAMGADVTVFSHSPNKKDDAKRMGAKEFLVVKNRADLNSEIKQYDLIINTVSAEIDLEWYIDCLRLDGTIVLVGLPGKPYSISTPILLSQRRSVSGSMIGGIPELQEMLDFCGKHNIVSDIELIDPDYINTAYDRTVASDVKYRFVINASKF